jgi:hypothetical protein
MNRKEHLLTILAEEGAEVGQIVSKILRFGMDDVMPGQFQTNEDRLIEEFNDLVGMMQMLREEGIIKKPFMNQILCDGKKARVERFLKYSRRKGTLEEPPPIVIQALARAKGGRNR